MLVTQPLDDENTRTRRQLATITAAEQNRGWPAVRAVRGGRVEGCALRMVLSMHAVECHGHGQGRDAAAPTNTQTLGCHAWKIGREGRQACGSEDEGKTKKTFSSSSSFFSPSFSAPSRSLFQRCEVPAAPCNQPLSPPHSHAHAPGAWWRMVAAGARQQPLLG